MQLTIRSQIEDMRRAWPSFRVLGQAGWFVTWEGQLQPLGQAYTVRVFFCLGCDLGGARIMPCFPRVTVTEPPLRLRSKNPHEPVPHHYPNPTCPERPILCLFDPAAGEWRFTDSIADTIIPWTVDWLGCYEGWLATGEWTGGGRHATIQETRQCSTTMGENLRNDPPARSSSAVFHSLGQKIGISASFPLMAAASVGSSLPLSWLDWRNAIWAGNPWRNTLISSLEPPPGESLPLASPPALKPLSYAISMLIADAKSSPLSEADLSGLRNTI